MATILKRLAKAEKRIDELEGRADELADAWFEALKRMDRWDRVARVSQRWGAKVTRRLQTLERQRKPKR